MKPLIFILTLLSFVCGDTLRVGTYPYAPCVFVNDGVPTGFSIEIFEEIAKDIGWEYKYVLFDNVDEVITAQKEGTIDVSAASVTITSEREGYIDFSYPYYNSGLSIIGRDKAEFSIFYKIGLYFQRAWRGLLALFIFIIVCGIIMWFLERGFPNFNDSFWKGTGDGAWWTEVTMTTVGYGDKFPQTVKGKIFASFVMWFGIAVVSPYVIAEMNQTLAIIRESSSVDYLKGKKIGVVANTTAHIEARDLKARVVTGKNIKEVFQMLETKKVDVVMTDLPMLKYYSKNNPDYVLSSTVLKKQDYGITFEYLSPLRDVFNRELLRMKEEGRYRKIHDKWM